MGNDAMSDICLSDDLDEIRSAAHEDLERVVEIEQLSFSSPWSYENFRVALEDLLLEDLFFVYGKEEVSGFLIACVCKDLSRAVILKIAVHPDHRGKGVATKLISRALETLKERNIREVQLDVDVVKNGARRLYEKFGFRIVELLSVDPEEDEVFYMMKMKFSDIP
jgi:ribosomal-protein-alanine N-acetyltransferase